MATAQLPLVLQGLRRAVLRCDGGLLTDGELLDAFVRHQDDAAFATLVRRHGPMVMSVCRRVLRNPDDAEDAFQATFLVLVRKGASVLPRERVGNWLHGVARITAIRANALSARRQRFEKQVVEVPEVEARPDENLLWREIRPLIDEELDRLPEKYRLPIVLCDLEKRTIRETARTLNWPPGTVAGRLARGRKILARRLTRRGIALSAATLATLLAQNASAHVPVFLMAASARLAHCSAGHAAAHLLAMKTVTLMEGVLKTMFWHKLKLAALACGFLGIAVGAGAWTMRSEAAEQPPAAPAAAKAPGHGKPRAEPPEYRVEVRLLEALGRPDTFHSEREVIWFPAMVMAENQPMKIRISETVPPQTNGVAAPQGGFTGSLQVSVKHRASGRMAVDMTLQEEKPMGGQRDDPLPYPLQHVTGTRHVAGTVDVGKIAKLALPKVGHHPRQWLEVKVTKDARTAPRLPPRRAQVYQIQLKLSEVQVTGERLLAKPILQVAEGKLAQFLSTDAAAQNPANPAASDLACTAKVDALKDGRLHLDLRMERAKTIRQGKDDTEVHSSRVHLVKVIRPNETVKVELEGTGQTGQPTRLKLVINPLKP